jgi:hypothetical protein
MTDLTNEQQGSHTSRLGGCALRRRRRSKNSGRRERVCAGAPIARTVRGGVAVGRAGGAKPPGKR